MAAAASTPYVLDEGARDLDGHDGSLADVLLDLLAHFGARSLTLGPQQIAGGQVNVAVFLKSKRRLSRDRGILECA